MQIANANVISINESHSRKRWMLESCDIMLELYPKEIGKIENRMIHFRQVRQRRLEKPEE